MSLTECRFALTTQKRKRNALQNLCAIAILAAVVVPGAPVHAGSASAQFQVSVRVEKGCAVSANALATQATSAQQTGNVSCGPASAPFGSPDSAGIGSALPTGGAQVNYSIREVPGTDGAIKLLSINF